MSDSVRLGVLGVGNIGTVHLQSARAMSGVTVAAVADAVPANRTRARELGVDAVYADFRELLAEESLDVAVVALPPFLHAEAVELAADRGCHAFVEKPFARTTEEAGRMVEAGRRAGVSIGVDHTLRYHEEMRRAKDEFEAGALGHVPLSVLSRVNTGPFEPPPATEPVSGWALDPGATGGGAVLDLGVHLFDLLEWFFGRMEVRHAELERQLDLPYEDTASVVLKSASTGTIAVVNCGFFQWEEPPEINLSFRLDGIARALDTSAFVPDNFPAYAARSALGNVGRALRGREPRYFAPTYYYRAHYRALEAFVDAVREGRPPPVTGADGRRTIELTETVYATADEPPRVEATPAGDPS